MGVKKMTKTNEARAYSYLRFSTPEQLKGDSLRRQTELAERYASTHALQLDTELNLRDLGVSAYRGANLETGALGAFLDAIKQRIVEPGAYLLVESLDRVSRKAARKAVRVLEEIVEAGVTVVTLNDGKARHTRLRVWTGSTS
jgi:DNA invertase Pin-like site-specific DNA recombinase